ncbi:hypothetical protein [Streptomyces malaysiensis]|uniref:Uncharacterized protein n=1 Tax=Streptomyces malaysiensis subsp. samsunensis TaxID=459658 RepID=A0A9X2LRD3_STRMQ|nr:hypothetical protein [Streptomyces samsunensis]MCQ8828219.1 hypothetical protein [Streptomyces samsunensis]
MHIVERDGRKTRFTDHGTRLLEEAQQIVGTHDAALRRLMGEGPADAVPIVVGATDHGADQILPVLTAAVRDTRGPYPDGLTPCHDLPAVPPVGLSARARGGCDPALTTATIEAVRALLGFRDMAPRAV